MSKQGYVYFITSEENRNAIKIGFTSKRKNKTPEDCISLRLRQLQTANSSKLKLLYYLEGEQSLEWSLHQMFGKRGNDYNIQLEWYDDSDGFISRWIDHKKLELKTLRELGLIKLRRV